MKKLLSCLSLIFCSLFSYSQNVGVGTNTPHASAALEVKDSARGILIPRMTATQRTSIASPAEGLMVYQVDSSSGFWYYSNDSWYRITGLLNGSNFQSGTRMSVFNTSGNFIVPNGISSVVVELWGGGGGASQGDAGSPGTWGKQSISVNPNQSYQVIVGQGGRGIYFGGPSDGSASSFATYNAPGGMSGGMAAFQPSPNTILGCKRCSIQIGHTLGYGLGGCTGCQSGSNGLVIIYY